jgi:hypothetical protein
MSTTSTTEITEVRPKVFADADGTEWRAYTAESGEIVLEIRDLEDDEDDASPLEASFIGNVGSDEPLHTTEGWLAYLDKPGTETSLAAARRAIATPMTLQELMDDDTAIGSPAATKRIEVTIGINVRAYRTREIDAPANASPAEIAALAQKAWDEDAGSWDDAADDSDDTRLPEGEENFNLIGYEQVST